jgi:hypothetical protein
VVILADLRYNRQDKRSKFPPWITQFLGESALNLSVDVAVSQVDGLCGLAVAYYLSRFALASHCFLPPFSASYHFISLYLISSHATSPLSYLISPLSQIKSFLKEMGQPVDQRALRSIVLSEQEVS